MGLFSWLRAALDSRPSVIEAKLSAVKRRVFAMQLPAAEEEVREWISSEADVEVFPEVAEPQLLALLPPSARRLLSEFGRLEVGGASVGGTHLRRSTFTSDAIVVGRDLEHSTVFMRLGSEQVLIVEAEVSGEAARPLTTYPSLAQYLLVIRATLKRDWWKEPAE
jgi:hypothetical protein